MKNNIVTSISARGFVIADYDTAHFTLSFTEFAPKAKEAKLKLNKGVEQIIATMDLLKSKGLEMGASTYITSIIVEPNYVYNANQHRNVLDGQKATFTLSFQTPNLDMVNEVYDLLSALDLFALVLNSPSYSVKAEAELKQQALVKAWETAKILFKNQCDVLKLDPTHYLVNNWDVDYSGKTYGKGANYTNTVMSFGSSSAEENVVELHSGRAKIEVTLTVNYSYVFANYFTLKE